MIFGAFFCLKNAYELASCSIKSEPWVAHCAQIKRRKYVLVI